MTLSPAAQAKRDELAEKNRIERNSQTISLKQVFNSGFEQGHAFAMQECAVLVGVLEDAINFSQCITTREMLKKTLATFKANQQGGED